MRTVHISGSALKFRQIRRLPINYLSDFSMYPPAGLTLRWYALTLDLTFFGPLEVLMSSLFGRYLEHLDAYGKSWIFLLIFMIVKLTSVILYFVLPTWINGQTLGKKMVGIKVVPSHLHGQPSFFCVLFRETIAKLASILSLGIGLLMIAFNQRRLSLHDLLASTIVINISKESP